MGIGKTEEDWEISAEGLYVATRSFLSRRGYCCANKCRNCPYINWHNNVDWQPLPSECVKRTHVSPKSLAAAEGRLHYHKQRLAESTTPSERETHQKMIEHYALLLQRWNGR